MLYVLIHIYNTYKTIKLVLLVNKGEYLVVLKSLSAWSLLSTTMTALWKLAYNNRIEVSKPIKLRLSLMLRFLTKLNTNSTVIGSRFRTEQTEAE